MKKNDLFYILFFPVMPLLFFHLPAYFLTVSAITIFLYGWDKWAAVRNLWRVPECALLFWALAGGSPAAILMMFLCRHKVSKPAFFIPFLLVLALQCSAVTYAQYRGWITFPALSGGG